MKFFILASNKRNIVLKGDLDKKLNRSYIKNVVAVYKHYVFTGAVFNAEITRRGEPTVYLMENFNARVSLDNAFD